MRAKTTWNQLKQSKKVVKQLETTRNFKIGEIWNFLLPFIFHISSPNTQFKRFGPKSITFPSQTLHVPYFEHIDFKCLICFWELWAQIPKFGHFRPKSMKFLILTKFCLYSISKVLISNLRLVFETFLPISPNLGILDQKVSIF